MKTTSLDARAVMQPGGLYEGVNNTLLQGLMAWLQSRDRERQGERDMRREERQASREQRTEAMTRAERYGVRPSAADAGWLSPDDHSTIDSVLTDRARKLATDATAAELADRMRRIQAARAGVEPTLSDSELLGENPPGAEWQAFEHGSAMRAAELARAQLAAQPKPAATAHDPQPWAYGRDASGRPVLFHRGTGDTRPIPGSRGPSVLPHDPADAGKDATPGAATAIVPTSSTPDEPGLLSRQMQRISDYWRHPTAQPRWSEPDIGAAQPAPTGVPAGPRLAARPVATSTVAAAPTAPGPSPLDALRAMPPEQRRAALRDLAQRDPATFAAIRQQLAGN
jgi:hypothetical protein